jgi:hypothetical protein
MFFWVGGPEFAKKSKRPDHRQHDRLFLFFSPAHRTTTSVRLTRLLPDNTRRELVDVVLELPHSL